MSTHERQPLVQCCLRGRSRLGRSRFGIPEVRPHLSYEEKAPRESLMNDEQDRFEAEGLNPVTSKDQMAPGEQEPDATAEPVSKNIATNMAFIRQIAPGQRKYVAYTIKLPSEQLAALQSIWLELKRLYGAHSPDKSGMIQQAVEDWLKRWDGPERSTLLDNLLEIRQDTRRRQYKKSI